MKKTILNIIKAIVFTCIVASLILASTEVLRRKDSNYKYDDFFDLAKKDQIDVLFMGSSHVINAVNPITLYSNYGYTSYNMGGHGSMLQSTYWELQLALEKCTPKWVVVDTYMLEKDFKYLDDREANDEDDINTSVDQLHLNMDVWPYSQTKVDAINDLIQDPKVRDEFLYDFIVYHNRWEYMEENDFKTLVGKGNKNPLMGAEMRYNVNLNVVAHPDPEEGETFEGETVGMEYLCKIIETCQERGINVLVTYDPFNAEYDDKIAANTAVQIAEEYDVPCINFLDEDVINIDTDINDNGHLNVTGAIKVTDYLGKWLSETGDLTDHRGDSAYALWDERKDNFYSELKDMAYSESNLFSKLHLLSMDQFSFVLLCNEGSQVFVDPNFKKLIHSITDTDKFEQSEGPYILIKDGASERIFEAQADEEFHGIKTSMGKLYFRPVERYYKLLYEEKDEDTNFLWDENHAEEDIQLIIYDNETGKIISHDYYTSKGGNYE